MGLMTLFQGPSFKYLLITKLIDLIIFEKLYYTFWQKNLFRDMWISCFMRLSFAYMAISETCRHDFYTFYIGMDIRALLMWWFQRQHWRLIKGMFPKSSPLHLEGHPSIWQLWNLSLSWSINLWRQLPRPRASCQVRNSSCRICHPSQTGQLCHLRQRRSQAHCKNMRGIPLLCYIDLTVWEIMVKIVTPKTTHFYQLPSLTLYRLE